MESLYLPPGAYWCVSHLLFLATFCWILSTKKLLPSLGRWEFFCQKLNTLVVIAKGLLSQSVKSHLPGIIHHHVLTLLVVVSPLMLCCYLLLFSQHAASASQNATASCPLLLQVATHLLAGCCVASVCAASTSRHLLSIRRLTYPSSSPHLHLHWLVVASYIVTLSLPPILLSTPLPHVAPATPLPICLSLAPTGCHVVSCGTSTSHPPACPPLHLPLLLSLILVRPG